MYNGLYSGGKETDAQFGKTEVEEGNFCVQRYTTSLVAKLVHTPKSNVDLTTLLSTRENLFYAENQCFHRKFLV